jgi:transposase
VDTSIALIFRVEVTMSKGTGKRRHFSAEFKLEAVRRLKERQAAGVSLNQVAYELGVRHDMLAAWSKQAEARAGAAPRDIFPGNGQLPTEQEELRRLQREVQRLSQENEFLKKAAAYFAKESR